MKTRSKLQRMEVTSRGVHGYTSSRFCKAQHKRETSNDDFILTIVLCNTALKTELYNIALKTSRRQTCTAASFSHH